MKKIKLDSIRIDGDTQMREVIDQPTVYRYVEDMKSGDIFPKMFAYFDGSTYWLVDGFHRYHAYKLLAVKDIEIDYKPGTLEEARNYACGANYSHGLPRSHADKRKAVVNALANPLNQGASNYEIAKICKVSQPLVASVRDPEVKKKQEENRQKSIEKKAKTTNPISSTKDLPDTNQISSEPNPQDGSTPDEDELKANELAHQADVEAMHKLLDADDALAAAHAEIKRLNHLNAQLKIRIDALMREKNEAIKDAKRAQAQLDKLKAKK